MARWLQSFPSVPFILYAWIIRFIRVALVRALAPLRRIVSREIEVLAFSRNSSHPALFLIHERLDCGHTYVAHEWMFRDLLFAYADPVESPHVTARRHRCHKCRDLALAKKPVGSVGIPSAAKVTA